jgi:hypothetical protein
MFGEEEMNPGTQVAYIPLHANDNFDHPDVEFGFVVKQENNGYFCKYWHKGRVGELRTINNSEFTYGHFLVEHDSVSQDMVDGLIEGMV